MSSLASHVRPSSLPPRQRLVTIAFVGALHVGVISALVLNLSPNIRLPVDNHTSVEVLPPTTPPKPPEPISSPLSSVPGVSVPQPMIEIAPAQQSSTAHAAPLTSQPVTHEDTTAMPPASIFVPAQAIAATHTIPQYPLLAVRLSQEGDVRLALTIADTGAVVDARVVISSGHPLLDAAAISWVESHWRYEPAKRDGKPVGAEAEAMVTFRLANR